MYFLVYENSFNTNASDLILVVYVNIVKYILTQINILVVSNKGWACVGVIEYSKREIRI